MVVVTGVVIVAVIDVVIVVIGVVFVVVIGFVVAAIGCFAFLGVNFPTFFDGLKFLTFFGWLSNKAGFLL